MVDRTGNRLILGDGTVLEGATAGYSQGWLWCYVPDMMMQTAVRTFLDNRKTENIIFQYGEKSVIYEGFINCTSLSIDVDGMLSACLKKEE